MSQKNIAVIVGSLRRDSFNAKLAGALAKLAPAEFTFTTVEIGDLPLYNQDDDANQAPQVKRLKAAISAADGLLFVTPEYNRSIPGVLKNAIDHASRPYGQSVWAGKPAGVIGISVGAIGTALAQRQLSPLASISRSRWSEGRMALRSGNLYCGRISTPSCASGIAPSQRSRPYAGRASLAPSNSHWHVI